MDCSALMANRKRQTTWLVCASTRLRKTRHFIARCLLRWIWRCPTSFGTIILYPLFWHYALEHLKRGPRAEACYDTMQLGQTAQDHAPQKFRFRHLAFLWLTNDDAAGTLSQFTQEKGSPCAAQTALQLVRLPPGAGDCRKLPAWELRRTDIMNEKLIRIPW